MKKEQLLEMIGEAPDTAIADAGKKRNKTLSRWSKWTIGVAAVLAVALLLNPPGIPLLLSAKAVSVASESRKASRPSNGSDSALYEQWLAERETRDELISAARSPIADFAAEGSEKLLSDTDGSGSIWSPINAYIALAMTAELTEGETNKELLSLLDVEDLPSLRRRISALWEEIDEDNGKEISTLANSLWLDEEISYRQETMDILAHDYYASVYQGKLGSAKTNRDILRWMKNQTGGMLSERSGSLTLKPGERQALTMVSTIYFRSKWGTEFRAENNTLALFHTTSGDVEATYLNHKECEMYYYWSEDFGAVQLPLENGSLMWFILPDEDKTLTEVLSSGEYMAMVSGSEAFPSENKKWMKVNLWIPKFDLSSGLNLKNALKELGVTTIFERYRKDFSSSILVEEEEYVFLSDIYQSSRVAIDEKGVEAASYIELNFGAGAAAPPDEVMDFAVDRPFLFVISKENIPLFVGSVLEP